MADKQIKVLDPGGMPGSIPESQINQALQEGYSVDTPEQQQKRALDTRFGGVGQTIAAGEEGLASALTGGLSTGVEKVLGVSEESIRGRKEAHPIAHTVGNIAGYALPLGVGAPAAISAAGELAPEALGLSGVASKAMKWATETALMQGSDEVSKALSHDPNQSLETAISNIGLAGALGGALPIAGKAALGMASKIPGGEALTKALESLRTKVELGLDKSGLEAGAKLSPEVENTLRAVQSSKSAADYLPSMSSLYMLAHGNIAGLGTYAAEQLNKNFGASAKEYLGGALLKFLGSSQPVDSAAFRSMSTLVGAMAKGEKMLAQATKAAISGGVSEFPSFGDKDHEDIEKVVDISRTDPMKLMNVGGNIGTYLPEHSTALGALAARVTNYLAAERPDKAPLGPLDKPRTLSAVEQAKWNRTLSIAQQPLTALKLMSQNRLTSKDILDLTSMYPSLAAKIQTSLAKELANHIQRGGTVPYRKRMQLSLALGMPLDSTLTQSHMGSLQSSYQMRKMQDVQQVNEKPPPASSMKGLSKLPSLSTTPNQAKTQRRQQVK